jgi:hypothetical protein
MANIDVAGETVNEDFTGASGTTFTVTRTVAAGSVLVLFATFDYSNGVTSATVSDNLNGAWPAALNLVGGSPNVDDTVDTQRLMAFVFRGTAAGSLTATITYVGATGAFRGLRIVEVTGANTSAAVDGAIGQSQITVGTGTDAVTSGNFTTANTPVLIVGIQGNFSAVAGIANAGTGFTPGASGFGGNAITEWKRDAGAAGTKAATFTNSVANGTRITIGLAIDEAAAAAPTAFIRQPAPFNIVGPGRFRGGPKFAPTRTFDTARTTALTGTEAVASTGTIAPAVSVALTGIAITASAGTLGRTTDAPLTGTAVTASAGNLNAGGDATAALTGQAVTVSAGTLSPSTSVPLAGSAATASAGSMAPAAAIPLAGASSTVSAGSLAPSTSTALTGSSVTASAGTLSSGTDCLYRCSPNGRYITRNGDPFYIVGDSAFGLSNQLSLANVATYLTTREAQGFNSVFVSFVCHETNTTNSPADALGNLPFTTKDGGGSYTGTSGTADFSTPNDTYFAYLKSVIDLCEARGFLVLAYILPWGIAGSGNAGWWPDLVNGSNTQAVCTAFGTYLATGHGAFAGFKNNRGLILMNGSDYGQNRVADPPTTEGETRALKISRAMVAAGATQLQTGDWQAPSMSTDEPIFETWMQLNGCYTYDSVYPDSTSPSDTLRTYLQARAGYSYVPISGNQSQNGALPSAIPVFGKETAFEHSPFATASPPPAISDIRKAQNWMWLSGATAGIFYGDEHIWTFPTNGSWVAALTDTSALDFARFSTFVRSLRWWNLIPSELAGMRKLIGGAQGSQSSPADDYVAAACSSEGDFMVAYVPPFSSGAQSISVDTRSLAGTARARWWDPTSGTYQAATPSLVANTVSAQSFTTPGANSAGDNDWFLLLEVPTPGVSTSIPPFKMVGPGRFQAGPKFAPSRRFQATSPDVTAALTGTSVSVQSGTLGPSAAAPLGGSAITAQAGTLASSAAAPISGTAATVSTGTLGPTADLGLSGAAVTSGAGTLAPTVAAALSGASVTAAAGTLGPTAAVPLTGSSVTASSGTITASSPGVAGLAGIAVTLDAGTIAAQSAVPLGGQALAASAGTLGANVTVPLTGVAVSAQAGQLGVTAAAALTGSGIAGAAGVFGPAASVPILGEQATMSAGDLTPDTGGSAQLTGVEIAVSAGTLTVTSSSTVALTGIAITVSAGLLASGAPPLPRAATGGNPTRARSSRSNRTS